MKTILLISSAFILVIIGFRLLRNYMHMRRFIAQLERGDKVKVTYLGETYHAIIKGFQDNGKTVRVVIYYNGKKKLITQPVNMILPC